MNFIPGRLITLRKALGINKAEAARRLNMSAMGYGRYESGEREPSYQTVCHIAQVFHTSTNYLYGLTDSCKANTLTISANEEPDLFTLVQSAREDEVLLERLLAYAEAEKIRNQY